MADNLIGSVSRRRVLQSASAIAAAIAVGGLPAANAQTPTQPVSGGTLRLGLGGGASTDSLDPAKSVAQVCLVTHRNWGDTLVETHPTSGAPVPSLAESWTSSADAKTWTFKIRKGIEFHDGTPLSVSDCVETLLRHSDPASESLVLALMKPMVKIEDRGGDLVVKLDQGNADFPLMLADFHLVVQPKGGREKPTAGIGTGPYKVVDWQPGVRAVFERNENDWRQDRGYVKTIELLVMNDATARIASLSSGQVDFINLVDPKTVNLLGRSSSIEILDTPARGHVTFNVHCDVAPYSSNDLRMALKYAIDREELVKKVLNGYGVVGNDFPINSLYPFFPEGIEQRRFDPDKAAFHFKKSGHQGPLELFVSDVAFPGAVDAAALYKNSCEKAGIDLQIQRTPGDGYWASVWNVKPFSANYWGGRPTQDQQYSLAYRSTADWNDTHFWKPEFDEMLLKARSELDGGVRGELYRKMAMMVRDEGGVIIPMFNNFLNAASKKLKGYVHDTSNDMSNGYVCSRVWFGA